MKARAVKKLRNSGHGRETQKTAVFFQFRCGRNRLQVLPEAAHTFGVLKLETGDSRRSSGRLQLTVDTTSVSSTGIFAQPTSEIDERRVHLKDTLCKPPPDHACHLGFRKEATVQPFSDDQSSGWEHLLRLSLIWKLWRASGAVRFATRLHHCATSFAKSRSSYDWQFEMAKGIVPEGNTTSAHYGDLVSCDLLIREAVRELLETFLGFRLHPSLPFGTKYEATFMYLGQIHGLEQRIFQTNFNRYSTIQFNYRTEKLTYPPVLRGCRKRRGCGRCPPVFPVEMWLIDLRVVDGDSRTNSYAEIAHCRLKAELRMVI
ncbi:Hepatocyte growth factor receptor [Trichinella pseudospiralis]